MALDGQRGPLRAAEADRHALPQRACRRSCEARLRHREDPCRRALRDRRRLARHDRGVLDPARRDRGGDGGAESRQLRRQSAIGRTRGADDARRQARHRPGGIAGRLAETGRRSRAGCRSAGIRSRRQIRLAGARSGRGTGKRAGQGTGFGGSGAPGHRRHATSGLLGDEGTIGRSGAWPGPGTHVRSGNNSGSFGCIPCGGGRRLGDGASLGARGRLLPRRSLRRGAGPCTGHDRHRGGRARGRGAGEGRNPAPRGHARRRGLVRDCEDRRRGTRDRGLDARRPGPRGRADAKLASAGIPQQGAAHGRAEGRREADPGGGGSRHRRAGLRRLRQDHHARPGTGAGREEGLPHDRPRAVRLGGADAGVRSRHRVRNPPDASSPAMRASPRAG